LTRFVDLMGRSAPVAPIGLCFDLLYLQWASIVLNMWD